MRRALISVHCYWMKCSFFFELWLTMRSYILGFQDGFETATEEVLSSVWEAAPEEAACFVYDEEPGTTPQLGPGYTGSSRRRSIQPRNVA